MDWMLFFQLMILMFWAAALLGAIVSELVKKGDK